MQSKRKKPVIEQTYRKPDSGIDELRNNDRLIKLFEILMQIDQKQKRNGKSLNLSSALTFKKDNA